MLGCLAPDANNQKACRKRVKRTRVPDRALASQSSNFIDNIVRRGSSWLVDQEKSVHVA